jgi:hypothetical protein
LDYRAFSLIILGIAAGAVKSEGHERHPLARKVRWEKPGTFHARLARAKWQMRPRNYIAFFADRE